jgi:hypothetical protein
LRGFLFFGGEIMADKMKLELFLKGNDQLSRVIEKNSKALRDFKKEAESNFKTLEKLFKISGKFKTVDKKNFDFSAQFKKSASEADRFTQKLNEVVRLHSKAAKAAQTITKQPQFATDNERPFKRRTPKDELDTVFGKDKKQKGVINRAADFNDRYIEPTKQIASTWKDGLDSLRQYTDETLRLYRVQERFKTINLSQDENQKAFDAIKKTVQEFKGVNLAETTQTFTDLFNALGNVDAAIQALPMAAKFQRSMNALYGDVFSPEQINRQILSSYKFAELTGASGNRAELEKTIDALSKITNSTGGEVTSANMLLAAKRGKSSMKNLSPQGLLNVAAVVDEFGGDNTGTSLMSLSQALVGGVMKQRAAERFDYFGLLDRSKIEYGNGQRIKKLQPGANKLGDLVQKDPLAAADMLRDAMAAKGVNVSNPGDVEKELYILFGNRNAQALMSKYINEREQVVKEASRAGNSKGVIGLDKQIFDDGTDLAKILEYEAAWQDFKTKLGVPLLKTGTDITKAITPIVKYASEHPEVMRLALAIVAVSKGINLFGQTASILNGSGFSSFFSKSKNAANDAADAFARTNRAAIGSVDSVNRAEKKISGLKGTLNKLTSSPFAISLSVVAAGMTLDVLLQTLSSIQERSKQLEADNKSAKDSYDLLFNKGALWNYSKQSEQNNKDIDLNLKPILDVMKQGKALEFAFYPDRAGYTEHLAKDDRPFTYKGIDGAIFGTNKLTDLLGLSPFDPDEASKQWKKSEPIAKALQDPNVLARVRRQLIQDLSLDSTMSNWLDNALAKVTSPEKVATAKGINLKEIGGGLVFSKLGRNNFGGNLFSQPNTPNQTQPNIFSNPLKQPNFFGNSINQLNPPFSLLNQQTQGIGKGFTQLNQPLFSTAQNFQSLVTPSGDLSGSFSTLNTNAEPLPNSFNSANAAVNSFAFSTQGVANRINALEIKAPSFSAFTFNAPNAPNTQSGNKSNKKPFTLPGTVFDRPLGRAMGGGVQKGHTYQINERGQEFFTPSVSGSIVTNDALQRVSKAREILRSEQQTRQNILTPKAGFSTEIGFNPSFPETEKNRLKPTSSNPRESFSPFRIKENRERKVFNREGGNADSEIANNVSVSRRGGSSGAPNIFNITVQVQGNVADAERTGQMIGSAVVREIEKKMRNLESRVSTVEYDTDPRRLTRAVDRVHQRRSELT